MKTKKLIREVVEEYSDGRLTADVAMLIIANLVKRKERTIPTQGDSTAINWGVETIKRLALHDGTGAVNIDNYLDTNKSEISVSRNL